jgi:DNA-binding transcriptional ArsR family regulator
MDGTLVALAEPNRLRIVEMLRKGPSSVNEIAERLELSQPLVSKHLRVLREAGIVQVRAAAQQRVYELRPEPFEQLETWVGSFRRLWEHRLDSLDDYVQQMKRDEKRARKQEH